MSSQHKRRNYFIKKDFQGKYIFSYFINVLAGSIIFALILSIISADTMTIIYDDNGVQLGRTPLILLKELLIAHWALIVGGGILIIFGSMIFTHRIAGPLFRFEHTLDEMIQGNFSFKIYLRQKDESKEVAIKFNRLNEMLSNRFGEMKRLSGQIDTSLAGMIETEGDPDVTDKTRSELKQIETLNGQLQEILNGFTLSEAK